MPDSRASPGVIDVDLELGAFEAIVIANVAQAAVTTFARLPHVSEQARALGGNAGMVAATLPPSAAPRASFSLAIRAASARCLARSILVSYCFVFRT